MLEADLRDEAKTAGLVPLGGPLILRLSVITHDLASSYQRDKRLRKRDKDLGQKLGWPRRAAVDVQKRSSTILRDVCMVCKAGSAEFGAFFFLVHFSFSSLRLALFLSLLLPHHTSLIVCEKQQVFYVETSIISSLPSLATCY